MKIICSLYFLVGCLFIQSCLASDIYWEQVQSVHQIKPEYNQFIPLPAKININTADKRTLMKLGGIGAKKADAIILYRRQQGYFNNLQELLKVKGFTKKILANILEKNKGILTVTENP
jgi:competence ComEA-like helix-hairpin-helix protein